MILQLPRKVWNPSWITEHLRWTTLCLNDAEYTNWKMCELRLRNLRPGILFEGPNQQMQLPNKWGKGLKCPIMSSPCPHRQWACQGIACPWPQSHNSQDASNMKDSHSHSRQPQCYGPWIQNCQCCQQMELMTSVLPTTTATKNIETQNQYICGNCTKSHAPDRASCPAKDSTCQACGRFGHWDVRCQSTSSKQKDPNKKPPRCGPKGGKQKQAHTVDVGNDCDPQCDELCVITIDLHPHHSAWLGWKPGDYHASPSALSPWVAQNAHSATKVPPSACPP